MRAFDIAHDDCFVSWASLGLYINVVRPANVSAYAKLPVLFVRIAYQPQVQRPHTVGRFLEDLRRWICRRLECNVRLSHDSCYIDR